MATYSKQILTGSTNGRPIEVVATSSPGTTLHTVVASATADKEALHLYAINSATTDRILSLELAARQRSTFSKCSSPHRTGRSWCLLAGP